MINIDEVSHETPDCYCPSCGKKFNMASSVKHKSGRGPKGGDFSICIACGEASRYNDDLSLRKLTTEDAHECPPELAEYSMTVKAFHLMEGSKIHGTA